MSNKVCVRIGSLHWILVATIAGCCSPATFQVETVIHGDGTCTRTIWQPKEHFLPKEALTPDWNSRWESVSGAPCPPKRAKAGAPIEKYPYIMARGSFRTPEEIPSHYRYVNKNFPDAGASEIHRNYHRIDYGFVVEHRWKEKITNIVTLPKFIKARDELLEILIPFVVEAIQQEFGNSYDVSQLVVYVRTDGKKFLKEIAVTLYDAAARHRLEDEFTASFADLASKYGLNLRDDQGNMVSDKEQGRRREHFFRSLIAKKVKHRDGRPLTPDEVNAIVTTKRESDDRQDKAFEKRWKQAEDRVGLLLLRMTGLYGPLAFLFRGGVPRYQFTVELPGQLIQTNGTIATPDQAKWKFTGTQLFPDGYEMTARSVVLNREAQKKILGRLAISNGAEAEDFIELVKQDGALFDAMRKVHDSGDVSALRDFETRSAEELLRVNKLRKMLLRE